MSAMIVPKGWEVKRFGELAKINMGQSPDSEFVNEQREGIAFLQGNAEFGAIYPSEKYWVTEPKKVAEAGEILVSVRAPVGKINRANQSYCIGRGLASLKINKLDPEYGYFAFSLAKNQLNRLAQGSTFLAISKDDLNVISILVPPKSEQQKIATILSTLDRTIEATQKLIDKEKMVKKGLMADLLTHGIDEQEWGEKRLIDVVDKSDRYSFTGGPFGSDLKSSDYVEQGVRVLQLQNIGDGKFKNNDFVYTSEEKAEELKSCQIFPDEIIMSKMGDPVGRACLIPNIEPKYVMCSDGIRIAVNRKEYDNKFIYYTINHDTFRKSIERVALGSTRKRVGLTELKVLTFYVPSLPEQQKIAQILSAQDRKIETEESNLAKLKNLKKGLMGDLLSGKVRVKI